MSWNYRVMSNNGKLAIYEVYYDDEGEIQNYSKEPVCPEEHTLEDLTEHLERYCAALQEPILQYE